MSQLFMDDVVQVIEELQQDNTVPRNVKLKLQKIVELLKEETDNSIKVNKALNVLEEIGDDINMESYTRTQIWNIASMLEKL